MHEYINHIRTHVDVAMAMLIWLVQVVIYPAYHSIDKERFVLWHHRYIKTISYLVIPLMFGQAISLGIQCLERFTVLHAIEILLVLGAWAVTFTRSVPYHNRLQMNGKDQETIKQLVKTNWLRTIAWSGVMVLGWFST